MKKYQDISRAKRKQLYTVHSYFKILRIKLRESIPNYFSRMMVVINKMRIYDNKTEDVLIIEKILRSLTPQFNFVVFVIE